MTLAFLSVYQLAARLRLELFRFSFAALKKSLFDLLFFVAFLFCGCGLFVFFVVMVILLLLVVVLLLFCVLLLLLLLLF